MVCLDFYGLPGSGKSTISHLVAEKLRGKAIVVEPSYELDHGCSLIKRLAGKSNAVMVLVLKHPKVFLKIVNIITSCGFKGSDYAFYIHLLNICYKILSLKKIDERILIFDQGLWQSTMSLFYRKDDKADFLNVYDKLQSLVNRNVTIVNIKIMVDIDTAIDRMDNRHTNISRVQLLSDEDRIVELKELSLMIERIPATSFVVDSGKMDEHTCANKIILGLNEFIGH